MPDRESEEKTIRNGANPVAAELDAVDFQGIHDIVDEEQSKISVAAEQVRDTTPAEKPDPFILKSIQKSPPPPPVNIPLTPPPPPVRGVSDMGVEYIEVSLGTPKQFDQMFKPSDTYAGDQTLDDDDGKAPAAPKPSFFARLRKNAPEEPKRTLEQAMGHAKWYARSLRLRFLASLAFLAPLLALSALQTGDTLPDALRYVKEPYILITVLLLLHLVVIVLGIDLLGKGFSDLIHLRPGAETLLLFAAFATLLHSFTDVAPFAVFERSVGFLPYSAVSASAISFALWGQSRRYKAYARNYKTVLAGGAAPDTVVCEEAVLDEKPGFSRCPQGVADFHHISERPDVATRVMGFLAPLLILFSIILALIADQSHPEGQFFTWALAALANAAVPLTTFWVYSGFYARLSARLAHMGAALAGWPAALEMSRGSSAILTDGDLFPVGSVVPNGKRIDNHASGQILSYAASLLEASGSGLFRVFREMLADENGTLRKVSSLQAGDGGLSGVIEGNTVLLGTLNYMFSEGMDMPRESRLKNGVFIAINRQLAGIFVILYYPSAQVEGALALMDSQKLSILLATRDFNITPNLLKEKYHVNPDPIDYPDAEQRAELSRPSRPRRGIPAAVLTRDGLCPYVEAIVGGRRLHRVTVVNLAVQLLALFSTLFIVYFFTRSPATEAAMSISPGNLCFYMGIWWLIQWAISWFGSRY